MPQLDPAFFASQLFWLFATFIVLFLVAWKIALPRIAEVINTRSDRIDTDLEKAEALKSEAEEVLQAYEAALANAVAEAQELHRTQAHELAEERARKHEELSHKLSEEGRQAEQRIAVEKENAVERLHEATRDVVRSATTRLIGVDIAEQDAENALKAAIEER
ncbi:MAG: F0F1 ATP synthase subunit B' [Alphaproteobacteria bacterium]|nr:F0F1 ATP synthase subunit B' [Alphaproteobacteria bacterium]